LAMILIEYLDEATHVGALEVMGQVNIHVDARNRLLLLFVLVHDDDRVADILNADLVDGDVAIVVALLHVRHAAGVAGGARGVWRVLRRTLVLLCLIHFFAFSRNALRATRHIINRIFQARLAKAFQTQKAGIAASAGNSCRSRIITGVGQAIVNAEVQTSANNFRLAELD